jgi:hypothetical protein
VPLVRKRSKRATVSATGHARSAAFVRSLFCRSCDLLWPDFVVMEPRVKLLQSSTTHETVTLELILAEFHVGIHSLVFRKMATP